jgi:hypothetical protein
MRSLWRMIALQWLGGEGSEALSGEWTLLDLLMAGETVRGPQGFEVTRRSEVSHHAMMSPQENPPSLEPVLDGKYRGDGSG